MESCLTRIEWDEAGIAQRVFPLARTRGEQPRTILIDPRIGFGRPVINGTGIPTEAIVARHRAGESFLELAEDYGLKPELVEDAVRYEMRPAA